MKLKGFWEVKRLGIHNFVGNFYGMNQIIQNILVVLTVSAAVWFLVQKFLWKPKKAKTTKACGNDGCGCS